MTNGRGKTLGARARVGLVFVAALLALGCGGETGASGGGTGSGESGGSGPGTAAAGGLGRSAAAWGLEALPTPTLDMPRALLGRRLYFETRLSRDGTISCATCHSLDHGGAEPRVTSIGIGGAVGPINSPTVLNASLGIAQFWDGRAATLEDQARGPVENPLEMGTTFEAVVSSLLSDPSYVAEFARVYPDGGITEGNIVGAIAEYERSLVTPGRFDRFLGGDSIALTAEERAGYDLFTSVGCTSCHRGPALGNTMFQRLGVVRDYFAEVGRPLTDADNGRYNVTHDESHRHSFKVPTLRNVALTAPYFHDGSRATLEDAVTAMGRYQLGRDFSADELRQLVAFLGALTGELPAHARPPAGEAAAPAPAAAPEPTVASATGAPTAPAPPAP